MGEKIMFEDKTVSIEEWTIPVQEISGFELSQNDSWIEKIEETFKGAQDLEKDRQLEETIRKSFVTGQKQIFGERTERYSSKELIGEGASGSVWLVKDKDLNRDVAVKSFKLGGRQGQEECQSEIQFVGRIEHPGIPSIYDVGVDESGEYYCVQKYIRGKTLKEIITLLKDGDAETHQKYVFHRRAELMIQLLRILVSIHEKNIVHRDIKPANILVDDTGHLWLLDWNIALDLEKRTGEGEFCGTPYYMSPEQALFQKIDGRSDIFSFMTVFYEFLSLERRLPSNLKLPAMIRTIPRHIAKGYDLIEHDVQGYPPSDYKAIMNKGLSLKPQDRYQTAQELLVDLEMAQSGYVSVVCPRSSIKHHVTRYLRWVDRDPYRNIRYSVLSLICVVGLLLGFGVLIGILMTQT